MGFQDQLSLNTGQKHWNPPALSYHMALRPLFCLFLSGRLKQVSLYSSCFYFPENINQRRTPNLAQTEFSEKSLNNKTGNHLQLQRLQRLQNACVDKDIFKNVSYNGENLNTKFYSSRYNFSICKVPKAGCSFFKQVFTILENGAQVSKDIFGVNRYALHHGKLRRDDYIGFKRNSRRISRTVLVSRDPYTRLFSAFIDKMFLPLMYGAAVGIVQRQRTPNNRNLSCANDITFEEFFIRYYRWCQRRKIT